MLGRALGLWLLSLAALAPRAAAQAPEPQELSDGLEADAAGNPLPPLDTLTLPAPPDILIAPPPDWRPHELHASEERRDRATQNGSGRALGYGIVGGLVGELAAIAFASLAALTVGSTALCSPAPGAPEQDCETALSEAAFFSAAAATPLGVIAGVLVGNDLAGEDADVGWTVLGTLLGYIVLGILSPIAAATEDEAVILGVGAAVSLMTGPLCGALGATAN